MVTKLLSKYNIFLSKKKKTALNLIARIGTVMMHLTMNTQCLRLEEKQSWA